ncbi:hypothetical protein RBD99_002889 [Salmonella enterica]|nr:hypothetical protein [Salmonella enterica]
MVNQSAYQAAVHAGYKGTYEEWEAELSKGYTLNQVLERELQLGKLTMKREYMFPPKELTDALSKGDVRSVSIRNTPVRIRGEQLGPSQINNTKHYLPASEMKSEDLWAALERPSEPNVNGVVYSRDAMEKAVKKYKEKHPDLISLTKSEIRQRNPNFDYNSIFSMSQEDNLASGLRDMLQRRRIMKPGYTYRISGIEPYWDEDSRSYKLAPLYEKRIRKPELPIERADDYNRDLYAYNHAFIASLYNALELTRNALHNRSVAASKFIIDAFADNNKVVKRPYFTSVDHDFYSIAVNDWARMMNELYPDSYSQGVKYPVPKHIVESIDTNDYRTDSKLAKVFGATKKVPTYIFHPLFGRTLNTELK